MNSLHHALVALGMGVGFACDIEVEDPERLETLEDHEDLEDLRAVDDELAAGLSCSAIRNETQVCIGDSVCTYTDHHGETHYRFTPPGGCPEGEIEIQTTTVDIACDAAKALTDAPDCPSGCAGPVTSTSQNATCCTATETCFDPPAPVPVPGVVVEDDG